jgi:hypothetical protein
MKTFLKYFLAIILSAGIASSGTWYYFNNKFKNEKSDLDKQITTLNDKVVALEKAAITASTSATSTTPTTDETTGWKTATDNTYGLSFKYPSTWPNAKIESSAGGENAIQPISSDNITFGANTSSDDFYIRDVNVTKYSDYPDSWSDKLTVMKKVYTNKNAIGADKLLLPGVEAATMANTAPTYIATADGKWRGIYYFANIGQAYTTEISCVIQMTDGTNNIVQFFVSQDSKKAAQYKGKLGENSPFLTYVSSLTASSDETVVTNFNEIFQYMAKSLKSL